MTHILVLVGLSLVIPAVLTTDGIVSDKLDKLLHILEENPDRIAQLVDVLERLPELDRVLTRLSEVEGELERLQDVERKYQMILEDQATSTDESTDSRDDDRISDDMDKTVEVGNQTEISEKNPSKLNKLTIQRENIDHKKATHLRKRSTLLRQNRQYPDYVAFTAGVSAPDLTTLGAHQTIIFDRVILNHGNAYHPHTGVFMVPIHGVYTVAAVAMTAPGKSQYLEILVNGHQVSDFLSQSEPSHYNSVTRIWTLELSANSEVWISAKSAGEIHGYMHTTFSAWLLTSLE